MTAFELIDSIFSRCQAGRPGNERGISVDQLIYLRKLIGKHPEGGAVEQLGPGRTRWMPMGRWKYEVVEDLHGKQHMLIKQGNIVPSETGRLF